MIYTLNCGGQLIQADRPFVMGILNYTEDSFYEGSRLHSDADVLNKAIAMAAEGCDIIDIGAQSTRPGSMRIDSKSEIQKLQHLIPGLKKETGKLISVDTYHSEVASVAADAGADIINDISGGSMDEKMISVVGKTNLPYICMHTRGTPENMQTLTHYEDIIKELIQYFTEKIERCRMAGIHDIIIDPGFGFAKTREQNFYLLKHLSLFKILQKPILAGISRKSFIYKTLDTTPDKALNGTTFLHALALSNGADILRVHDVKEAVEALNLWNAYQKSEKENLH